MAEQVIQNRLNKPYLAEIYHAVKKRKRKHLSQTSLYILEESTKKSLLNQFGTERSSSLQILLEDRKKFRELGVTSSQLLYPSYSLSSTCALGKVCKEVLYFTPLYTSAIKQWVRRYDDEERVDIWKYAVYTLARLIEEAEADSFLRIVMGAATGHRSSMFQHTLPAIQWMAEELHRRGEVLDSVILSPHHTAHLREARNVLLSDPYACQPIGQMLCEHFNYQMHVQVGGQTIPVTLVERLELGPTGEYNMNGLGSYGLFTGERFHNYTIQHPNIIDREGVRTPGETQIYGLSKKNKTYLQYVKPIVTTCDYRATVYGPENSILDVHHEWSVNLLTNVGIIMGVVDFAN